MRRATLALLGAAALATAAGAAVIVIKPDPTAPLPPMTTPEIRAAFAECRAKDNEVSRFFCECELLDRQCESARHPTHGEWRTMEYWPSDDVGEREIFLFLAPRTDTLERLDEPQQGLMVHCINGSKTVTALLGGNVKVGSETAISTEDTPWPATLDEHDMNVMLVVDGPTAFTDALARSDTAHVSYADEWGDRVELTFDTGGFNAARAAWDAECGRGQ